MAEGEWMVEGAVGNGSLSNPGSVHPMITDLSKAKNSSSSQRHQRKNSIPGEKEPEPEAETTINKEKKKTTQGNKQNTKPPQRYKRHPSSGNEAKRILDEGLEKDYMIKFKRNEAIFHTFTENDYVKVMETLKDLKIEFHSTQQQKMKK
ncbi:hypothetical protein JTB14_016770 [Gonioctena quinquepunctata]|nr:hypothetical protein JTB14_016770 [Gonioctena quinquepunctata]